MNPAQEQVLAELGSTDRPTFRPELRDELREELTDALEPFALMVDELFVSKRKLAMVHTCEVHFLAEEAEEFEWSVPAARGTVAHKAVELLVGYRGHPTPLELVDESMARLMNTPTSLAGFLETLSEGERAELVGAANDQVATFLETFPPLKREWRPVAESRVRADFSGGKIAMSGKIDLSLGYARDTSAGKVIIDLKTGRPNRSHLDDLRFYALLETLKLGVPPRLLVSYYLDSGTPHTEAVTEDLLWSSAKRTVDGVGIIAELKAGDREPTRNGGSSCFRCRMEGADESLADYPVTS